MTQSFLILQGERLLSQNANPFSFAAGPVSVQYLYLARKQKLGSSIVRARHG